MTALTISHLRSDILYALRKVYTEDFELLSNITDAEERCLVFRFAFYYATYIESECGQQIYQGVKVDCEYNREGIRGDPKTLTIAGENVNRIPDVVVHQRGQHARNLLVMEFKKKGINNESDYEKLKAFTTKTGHAYTWGVYVELWEDAVAMQWFADGKTYGKEERHELNG